MHIKRRTLQLREKEMKQKDTGSGRRICQAMRIKEGRDSGGRLGAVKNNQKKRAWVPSSSRDITVRRATPRKRGSGWGELFRLLGCDKVIFAGGDKKKNPPFVRRGFQSDGVQPIHPLAWCQTRQVELSLQLTHDKYSMCYLCFWLSIWIMYWGKKCPFDFLSFLDILCHLQIKNKPT